VKASTSTHKFTSQAAAMKQKHCEHAAKRAAKIETFWAGKNFHGVIFTNHFMQTIIIAQRRMEISVNFH
jgi:hypothetical protein